MASRIVTTTAPTKLARPSLVAVQTGMAMASRIVMTIAPTRPAHRRMGDAQRTAEVEMTTGVMKDHRRPDNSS